MKTYNSYKPSGEDFIGDIPENWECIRLGMLGVFSSSGIDKKINDNEVSVRMVNYTDIIQSRKYSPIQTGEKEYMTVSTPSSKLEEHRLKKGDMVFIPSSETKDDLGYSSLIDFEENDIVYSYHILRYRTIKNLYHYFKKYLINHHSVLNQFSRESKGTTRQIIGRNVFNNVRVVLPPLQEQEQIVKYLDEKTTIIDKLISTKERKIELLKEQRTSLINEVITKGLDPKVKMKDSGVEWIGTIPESWTSSSLRYYISKVGSGITPRGGSEVYVDEGVIFIRSQNVYFDGLRLRDVSKITPEIHNSMNGSKVLYEDILLNITGGSIGRCCVVTLNEEMNVNQHVCIVRTKKSILSPFFLNYILQSKVGQTQVDYFQTGGNREGLTVENIKSFFVVFPEMSEQIKIVEHIDKHTKEIDDLVSMEQKKIELLKEYRQSLISEVITGKIKVVE
jgi:type I restriction enzyme S subunit